MKRVTLLMCALALVSGGCGDDGASPTDEPTDVSTVRHPKINQGERSFTITDVYDNGVTPQDLDKACPNHGVAVALQPDSVTTPDGTYVQIIGWCNP